MEDSVLFPEILYGNNSFIKIDPPISRSKRRRMVKKQKARLKKKGKDGCAIDALPSISVKPPSSSSFSGVSPLSGVSSPDPTSRSICEDGVFAKGQLIITPAAGTRVEDDFTGKKRQLPSSDLGTCRYNLRLR